MLAIRSSSSPASTMPGFGCARRPGIGAWAARRVGFATLNQSLASFFSQPGAWAFLLLIVLYKLGDAFDQCRFIDVIWNFGNVDLMTPALHLFDVSNTAHHNTLVRQ